MSGRFSEASLKAKPKAYASIRSMCLEYQFWPKQQLLVDELATLVSSSATPVREALARLAGEGLIESIPNRGYFAKTLCCVEMESNISLLFLLLRHVLESQNFNQGWASTQTDGIEIIDKKSLLFTSERLFLRLALMGDNIALTSQVIRILDVTRFVRRLDIEDPDVEEDLYEAMKKLENHLINGCISLARSQIEQIERDITVRVASVVAKGLARSMSEKYKRPVFISVFQHI